MLRKIHFNTFSNVFLLLLLLFENLFVPARSEDVTKSLEANAPIEFPKNESQYHFLHNTTILKALTSQTRNDTEVDDLLHGGQFNDHGLDSNNSVGLSEVNSEDAQWLQDGSDTEDMRWRSNTTRSSIKTVGERDSYGAKMPVVHSQLAAISAGVLILIAVFGYAALLFWRRYLENRYGNREMLVNEDDFPVTDDLRHFSL